MSASGTSGKSLPAPCIHCENVGKRFSDASAESETVVDRGRADISCDRCFSTREEEDSEAVSRSEEKLRFGKLRLCDLAESNRVAALLSTSSEEEDDVSR